MNKHLIASAATGMLMLLAACGPNGRGSHSAATAGTVQAIDAQAASATPAQPDRCPEPAGDIVVVLVGDAGGGENVVGTVQSVAVDTLTLDKGRTFAVTPQTEVTGSASGTPSDLKPARWVSISAKRQADATLFAYQVTLDVSVSPEQRASTPGGYLRLRLGFPPACTVFEGTIESVTGNGYLVAGSGGSAQFTLAPNAQISLIDRGSTADLTLGKQILAVVSDGAARSVYILPFPAR